MKILVLFVLLVACGSILADTASDCAALKTKPTCAANSACKFTVASRCTNKCQALSLSDCVLPANSSFCDITYFCLQKDCSPFNTQQTCVAQDSCSWNQASNDCESSVSLAQCNSIYGQANCNLNKGCSWQPHGCTNKTSCQISDDQNTCTNNAKFCNYTEIGGTCSVISTSSSSGNQGTSSSSGNQGTSSNQGTQSNSGTPSNSNTPSTSSQILAISLITIIALI